MCIGALFKMVGTACQNLKNASLPRQFSEDPEPSLAGPWQDTPGGFSYMHHGKYKR
jgi:hypothetical protein